MFAGIVAAVAALVAAQNTQASHSSDCTSLADRLRSPSESARLAIGGHDPVSGGIGLLNLNLVE